MQYRQLGSLQVSVVGLGGNNFGTNFFGPGCDQAAVSRIVGAALDAGVNLIDTAEEYSITSVVGEGHSEELIGVALAGRRDKAVIATKFLNAAEDPEERGAKRIVAAVEASLRRLDTDWIDLYQQHQPDPDIPLDEILEALDRLVRQGKIREVGCCNFPGRMLEESSVTAETKGTVRFRSCQVQYSLLERPEGDLIQSAARAGVSLLAYFPLASGLLTGKYRRGEAPRPDTRLGADGVVSGMLREGLMARRPPLSEERMETVEAVSSFAAERGHTLLELAVSWLVSQRSITCVLTGATRPEQIAANAAAASWALSRGDLDAIDRILSEETV